MVQVRLLALIAVLTAYPRVVAAQDAADREAVRLAVLDYVEGFYEGDTIRLVRSVWPEVRKYGLLAPAAGRAVRRRGDAISGVHGLRQRSQVWSQPDPSGAPKEIEIFDVQDQTASAKLIAWWGTDYLLLAKEQGCWMIVQVLWQSAPPK